ncbi:hypothetical protein QCA50_005056 [Cerrena zonata]|uniref:Uncharacterized protein n=1 Tax=Cerrena zonata TaxID=2478898 RepID=A0AAW0GGA8_9APHY
MTDATYYGPVDESNLDIFWEKMWLISGYLTGVGFGIQLVVYCICADALLRRKQKTAFTHFLLGYTTLLCVLNCIFTGSNASGIQQTFIDNRNYPGGPWGYVTVGIVTAPFNFTSEVSYFLGNIMADALLLWRCKVIWVACKGPKATYVMMAFPTLMLATSLALAITSIVISAIPGVGFFSEIEGKINIAAYTISLSLNVILTIMIVALMWFTRKKFQMDLGRSCTTFNHYSFLSSIFVESAALYSFFVVPLLVTYGMNHPTSQIWLSLAPAAQMSSNYLIIYRVAQNRSWEVTSAMFTLDWPQQDYSTAPRVPAWRIREPSSADVTLHPSKGNVYTDEIVPSSHESGSFGSKGEQNV